MFRHILIPTDGSPLAEAAAREAIGLAKALGAKVTALTVVPRFHLLTYHTEVLEDTREEYERHSAAHAERNLGVVRRAAEEEGVACQVQERRSDDIDQTILEVARERGCDAIAMGSHGRRGLAGAILGSVTQRVLAHASIPVVVWH
ncbi:MAG TPA: universal stress protein [Caldimonas sp.]|nr:universal stress protein [Caldimonas sp.]